MWIAAIALIGAVSHGIAQDLAPLHQVQAVVDGVRSPQHAYKRTWSYGRCRAWS